MAAQPAEVDAVGSSPLSTRVVDVSRLVRAATDSGQDLRGFEDHLNHVLVTLHLSGDNGVCVEDEDIDFRFLPFYIYSKYNILFVQLFQIFYLVGKRYAFLGYTLKPVLLT